MPTWRYPRVARRPLVKGLSAVPETYPQRQFVLPPDATEVVLVRHGASAAAVPGEPFEQLEGQSDPPLAPEGEEQARAGAGGGGAGGAGGGAARGLGGAVRRLFRPPPAAHGAARRAARGAHRARAG